MNTLVIPRRLSSLYHSSSLSTTMNNGLPALLTITDEVANFLLKMVQDLIHHRTPEPFPAHWSLHAGVQCGRTARTLTAAYLSPGKSMSNHYRHFLTVPTVRCSIDIVQSAKWKKADLGVLPSPASRTIISRPSVIVDKYGHILVWHLPGILSAYTEVTISS